MILVFFVFALSRRTFSGRFNRTWPERIARDREVRLAGFAVVVLPTLLFMRHWLGALEVATVANFGDALQALWGGAFTVLSFLTTTGFVSDSWDGAGMVGAADAGAVAGGAGADGRRGGDHGGGVKLLGSMRSTSTACARWTG
jgi:trk system potassium uptake protein TrkH